MKDDISYWQDYFYEISSLLDDAANFYADGHISGEEERVEELIAQAAALKLVHIADMDEEGVLGQSVKNILGYISNRAQRALNIAAYPESYAAPKIRPFPLVHNYESSREENDYEKHYNEHIGGRPTLISPRPRL